MAQEESIVNDFESILNGTADFDAIQEETAEILSKDENSETNIEDTEVNSETNTEEDTNDQNADLDNDTSEELAEDSNGEDTQEDAENSEDDNRSEADSADGVDDEEDEKSGNGEDDESNDESNDEKETNVETDGLTNSDGDAKNENDSKEEELDKSNEPKVDYEAFYKEITGEFKANGIKVKGFSDPKKIIQAQQMLHDYNAKMSGFKEYRPFIGSLKKSGMVEDPNKFNLMMDIMNGDKEALKKHLKTLEIDPVVDLDLDNISYESNNYIDSKATLDVQDTMELARNLGVDDKFAQTVGKEWDEASFDEFTSKPNVRQDLLDHMSTRIDDNTDSPTVYDVVQDKISEMKLLDVNGGFGSQTSINQYRIALRTLNEEKNAEVESQIAKEKEIQSQKVSVDKVEVEKQKILEKRKAEEYKKQVEEKQKKEAEERKKASSVSKPKPKQTQEKKKIDPLKLSGEDFIKEFEKIGRV